jgi:hypothetical protein
MEKLRDGFPDNARESFLSQRSPTCSSPPATNYGMRVVSCMVRKLCLVLKSSFLEVLGEILVGFLAEFDFVLDGSSFVDGCSCFGITVCVDGSSRCGRCGGFFSFETLDFLFGLVDVLFHSQNCFLWFSWTKKTYLGSLSILISLPVIQFRLDLLPNTRNISSRHRRVDLQELAVFDDGWGTAVFGG